MQKHALAAVLVLMSLMTALNAHAQDRGAIILTPTDAGGPITLYQRSYALVIGIDNYGNGWPPLSNAINDARAVASALEQRGFVVELTLDPDSSQLRSTIEQFVFTKGQDADARLMIWFAGHGHTINGEGYLVPAGSPGPDNGAEFRRAALSLRSFGRYMREIRSRHVLTIFDSCFAGTIFDTARTPASPTIRRATTLPVRQFVSSGDADQVVSDNGDFRSLFIDALNGLEPHADSNRDGYITGTEIGLFLHDKITTLTGGRQTPRYGKLSALSLDRGDFVFSVSSQNNELAAKLPPDAPAQTDTAASTWQAIQGTDSSAVLEAFINEFPNSIYAKFARARLGELEIAIAALPDFHPKINCAATEILNDDERAQCSAQLEAFHSQYTQRLTIEHVDRKISSLSELPSQLSALISSAGAEYDETATDGLKDEGNRSIHISDRIDDFIRSKNFQHIPTEDPFWHILLSVRGGFYEGEGFQAGNPTIIEDIGLLMEHKLSRYGKEAIDRLEASRKSLDEKFMKLLHDHPEYEPG